MCLDAIIFDLDGTIVNSSEVQWYAFNEYLQRFNFQVSWEDWTRKYLGQKSNSIWEGIMHDNKIKFDISTAQTERRLIYQRLVSEDRLTEIKGFSPFYDFLKTPRDTEIPIVIASNGHPSSIETSLKAIGYHNKIRYYSAVKGNTKVNKKELLEYTVSDLQVDSSKCLIFEDSVLGATAAKSLDMQVIIINTSSLPIELFPADLIVSDFTSQKLHSFMEKKFTQRSG